MVYCFKSPTNYNGTVAKCTVGCIDLSAYRLSVCSSVIKRLQHQTWHASLYWIYADCGEAIIYTQ